MLMLPIGLAMLKILDDSQEIEGKRLPKNGDGTIGLPVPLRSAPLAVPLLLMVAYASSLGGMATLVGTPTNSAAVGIYRNQLPNAPEIYFSQWFVACVPISVIYFLVVWYVLVRKLPAASSSDQELSAGLRQRLNSLGPMTKPEFRMLVLFSTTAVLWVTREPLKFGSVELFSGWYQQYVQAVSWISMQLGTTPEVAQILQEGFHF